MSLKIIYGKAGSGKSTYLFKYIGSIINNPQKIYIVTPEQFSFTAERRLLECTKGAAINAEVLTFSRMAYRLINEIGNNLKTMEAFGRSILIYDLLEKSKDKLNLLGKSMQNVEIIENALTEFKKHNITKDKLKISVNQVEDTYLKMKLEDMSQIYEAYEDSIKDKFLDEQNALTILAENIKNTDMFNDSIICIDEFAGFTPQEYSVIAELVKVAKEVNIAICADSLENYETKTQETDIFYNNKLAINKLIKLAALNNVEVLKPVFLNENIRLKNNELIHLEQNIYANIYKKYDGESKNIKLFLANNPYSEIEYIASKITEEVRENNYRYKDIGIITKDLELYSSLIKAIFAKYDIPVYIDLKKDLSQNILIKYIISLLDVFAKNWSYESVIAYMKTGFCDIAKNDLYILENYCKKWGIKYSKWYKDDWDYGDIDKDYINNLRKKVVNPLLEFKEKCYKNETAQNITKTIYEFLIQNEIDSKLKIKAKELEKENSELEEEYQASFNTVIKILDEIVKIFGEEKIGFEKYMEFLKISFSENELGKIPAGMDQVTVGDVDRSKSHSVKIIFIIGLNDGNFPSVNNNEGFLNDSDREALKNIDIELAKTTLEALYNDNFNIYKAFTTSEEKLYLSYVSTDSDGTPKKPSTLLLKIKKIFPNLKEESDIITKPNIIANKKVTFDELLSNIRNYRDKKEINDVWFKVYDILKNDKEWNEKLKSAIKALDFSNNPENINKENIQRLYGNTLKTSISKLETYKSCPFSFYLNYGLKLKEQDNFKLQSIDTGSFMHNVIDAFFERLKTENLNVREIEDDVIQKIVNEIIEEKIGLPENYILTSSAKFRSQTIRLKRLILKAMKYLIRTIRESDFDVFGTEVEFGENKTYPPITIDLEDGRKVEIIGKIDRVDIAEDGEKKYLRIIDYKSSVRNIDFSDVVYGLQLQLLTYLDAVSKAEDVNPAGILYFNLIEPIIASSGEKSEEELEKEIRKNFKMKGLVLADVRVVKMMDKTLDTGYSDIIPVYVGDKDLSEKRSSVASKEEFELLQKYIIKTIKDISKEILSGNIDIKPYNKNKTTYCDYCKYKAVCGFDKNKAGNDYNYIPKLTKEAAFEKIKQEN